MKTCKGQVLKKQPSTHDIPSTQWKMGIMTKRTQYQSSPNWLSLNTAKTCKRICQGFKGITCLLIHKLISPCLAPTILLLILCCPIPRGCGWLDLIILNSDFTTTHLRYKLEKLWILQATENVILEIGNRHTDLIKKMLITTKLCDAPHVSHLKAVTQLTGQCNSVLGLVFECVQRYMSDLTINPSWTHQKKE